MEKLVDKLLVPAKRSLVTVMQGAAEGRDAKYKVDQPIQEVSRALAKELNPFLTRELPKALCCSYMRYIIGNSVSE